jgi:medium-chain acyl-[acyl-carrier-protein] hydrolase
MSIESGWTNKMKSNLSNEKFNIDYRIGFNHLLADNHISLPGLMVFVQEASLFHTYSIPGAFDYYDKMNWVWILTHWQVEIADYPKVADTINISTWPVGYRGFFGERGFEAVSDVGSDGKGQTLLHANSNWILLDRTSFKPVRPTDFIADKYGQTFPFILPKDFSMPKITAFEPLSEHKYRATRRDMDTNDHVNNVNYLKWVYDHIPDDIYYNYRPKSLKVAYKKETLPGDSLDIKLYHNAGADEAGKTLETFAIIEKEGKIATEIYITWK